MRSGNSLTNPNQAKFLLLTSSLLVDRVFLYTNLIESLRKCGDLTIWAASAGNDQTSSIWDNTDATIENLPEVLHLPEIPHNYLRRLNEYVWDYRFPLSSRISVMRHVKNKQDLSIRALKIPARFLATLRAERLLENKVEKFLLKYPRSPESEARLKKLKPSVMLNTGPFQFEQPGIFSAAKKLGIPTLAYIPSWDNITTKNRMLFKYDGYIVWSEQIKKELHEVYPYTQDKPVYVVGAPQYDIFRQEHFYQTREEFCREQQLNPELPLIVYAIGSPNFLKEHHGAIDLAERVVRGELGNVQMLVRPHPIHDNAEMRHIFDRFAPRIRLQQSPNAGLEVSERSQDEAQIVEWINTFRHADVVVNLSSTVTVDAGIFDRPVVNLDFDPQPGQADQGLIKDINHKWNHFKPVAESGGVWLVNNFAETAEAVKGYLKNPTLHRAERKWIVDYVCGYLDGKCGERMAKAVSDFAGLKPAKNKVKTETAVSVSLETQINNSIGS